jgi:ribonucleoside-triphosphate reductase
VLEVTEEGDADGQLMVFPKVDVMFSQETLDNPEAYEVFRRSCEVAAKNGNIYFNFSRGAVKVSQCCRLSTTITDNDMLRDPTQLRFFGVSNTSINLPQLGYKSKKNVEALWKELDAVVAIAIKATLQRKEYLDTLLKTDGSPLRPMGMLFHDGKPYADLSKGTYLIAMIGLNELVQFMTGKELHEGREAVEFGLQVISRIWFLIKEASAEHGIKFSAEEAPAEGSTRRICKCDLRYYPESREVMKGDIEGGNPYYTNSVHVRPDCPVDIIERIRIQSLFTPFIESGAVTHAFIGEQEVSAGAVESIVRKTFENSNCAQLTISPNISYCRVCKEVMRGMVAKCTKCGASDVDVRAVQPSGCNVTCAEIKTTFEEYEKSLSS